MGKGSDWGKMLKKQAIEVKRVHIFSESLRIFTSESGARQLIQGDMKEKRPRHKVYSGLYESKRNHKGFQKGSARDTVNGR